MSQVTSGSSPGNDLAVQHSMRFRKVSTLHPRMVAAAYHGDIVAAAQASDHEVAERVAAWERKEGWPVTDWVALGIEERGPDDDEALRVFWSREG